MKAKTILLTGATDGIGLRTAQELIQQGHHVLLHGRNPAKLKDVVESLTNSSTSDPPEHFVADLSCQRDVNQLAENVTAKHSRLDVLINNAGVFNIADPITEGGLDARFAVNTIAPHLLTTKLLPLLGPAGRVVNLSSAAQSPVNLKALKGEANLSDMDAYAQSKLALTMWSQEMAETYPDGPVFVAVNPGSLLGSKMVKEAFGVDGSDLQIGADILVRATLSDEFAQASGKYFDNDAGRFNAPHPDAANPSKRRAVVEAIEKIANTVV